MSNSDQTSKEVPKNQISKHITTKNDSSSSDSKSNVDLKETASVTSSSTSNVSSANKYVPNTSNDDEVLFIDDFDIPSTSRKSFSFSIRTERSKDGITEKGVEKWYRKEEGEDKNRKVPRSAVEESTNKAEDETIKTLEYKSNICNALEGKGDALLQSREKIEAMKTEKTSRDDKGDRIFQKKIKVCAHTPPIEIKSTHNSMFLLPKDKGQNDSSAPNGNCETTDTYPNQDLPQPPPVIVPQLSFNISSNYSMICRICQNNTANELLISPCNCKGSLAYVHLSCLERWLNQSCKSYCELCLYTYQSVQTKRYTLCQGLRIWLRHPRHRLIAQADILMSTILTLITIALVTLSLLSIKYFVGNDNSLRVTESWAKVALGVFLVIIIVGYFVTLYLLIRDQVMPWYSWWKNTVDVRLILSPSVMQGLPVP